LPRVPEYGVPRWELSDRTVVFVDSDMQPDAIAATAISVEGLVPGRLNSRELQNPVSCWSSDDPTHGRVRPNGHFRELEPRFGRPVRPVTLLRLVTAPSSNSSRPAPMTHSFLKYLAMGSGRNPADS
jgi:hypothetical protein